MQRPVTHTEHGDGAPDVAMMAGGVVVSVGVIKE